MVDKEFEFEGATEAEALAAAARSLGVPEGDLDYTLVDEGAEAVFGLGGRPARIRVAQMATSEADVEEPPSVETPTVELSDEEAEALFAEKAAAAEKTLREVLGFLKLNAELTVEKKDDDILLKIGDAEGSKAVEELFSSTKPPLAPALQFLLNKIVNRFPERRRHIVVEAAGSPQRFKPASRIRTVEGEEREEFDPELVRVAEWVAGKVLETGRVISINPMLAGERRALHQTIMKVKGARTVSSGEGLYRQLHILPEKERRPRGRRRRGSGGGGGESDRA